MMSEHGNPEEQLLLQSAAMRRLVGEMLQNMVDGADHLSPDVMMVLTQHLGTIASGLTGFRDSLNVISTDKTDSSWSKEPVSNEDTPEDYTKFASGSEGSVDGAAMAVPAIDGTLSQERTAPQSELVQAAVQKAKEVLDGGRLAGGGGISTWLTPIQTEVLNFLVTHRGEQLTINDFPAHIKLPNIRNFINRLKTSELAPYVHIAGSPRYRTYIFGDTTKSEELAPAAQSLTVSANATGGLTEIDDASVSLASSLTGDSPQTKELEAVTVNAEPPVRSPMENTAAIAGEPAQRVPSPLWFRDPERGGLYLKVGEITMPLSLIEKSILDIIAPAGANGVTFQDLRVQLSNSLTVGDLDTALTVLNRKLKKVGVTDMLNDVIRGEGDNRTRHVTFGVDISSAAE